MKTIRLKKILGTVLLLVASAYFASFAVAEEAKPVGKVSIDTKAVAVGVGYSWGGGVLTFDGKEHSFKVKGLSVIDVGVSEVSAVGDVYYLEKVEDFPGTFTAAEAGIAVGGGAGAQVMKNQNGVVIKVTSKKAGIQLKLAPEGLKVEME